MSEQSVDLSEYHNHLGRRHQITRLLWTVVWNIFARPLPRSVGNGWKRALLRMFGADIHPTATVYSSVKVYYPANLTMDAHSCLASGVDCYNVAPVHIGAHTTVSQRAVLCTASHDITDPYHRLLTAPVKIRDQAWVAAEAFIGMGVTVGTGAVIGARAAVFRDVPKWTVVGGNPAKEIKKRILRNDR